MIIIIDHGSGNLFAIGNILKNLKVEFKISNKIEDILKSDKFILPGVGSFDTTMNNLANLNIIEALSNEILVNKKHILGICVGMQILSNKSEEGNLKGLGWIPGEVKKIDKNKLKVLDLYLPHMGWNSLNSDRNDHPLLENINLSKGFYFLHNFFYSPKSIENIIAVANYGYDFCSIISSGNIHGVQFHPEKSHENGIQLLENFTKI
tara:strand:+ start:983 stop:1603 length:621 start_codon:yes stop_codon:yes gene_type:complete